MSIIVRYNNYIYKTKIYVGFKLHYETSIGGDINDISQYF